MRKVGSTLAAKHNLFKIISPKFHFQNTSKKRAFNNGLWSHSIIFFFFFKGKSSTRAFFYQNSKNIDHYTIALK